MRLSRLLAAAVGPSIDGTCHSLGHTWRESCLHVAAEVFIFVLEGSFKIYAPLYLVSDVLRRRPLLEVLTQTVPNILRSTLFLTINGSGFIACICLFRRLTRRFYLHISIFVPGLVASLVAILIERKSRRGLLMHYVMSLGVETLYHMLKYRGMVTPVPFGEVLLFCFGTAVLMHSYRSKEDRHSAIGAMFNLLFTPWLPQGVQRGIKSLRVSPSLKDRLLHTVLKTALVCGWSFALGYLLQAVVSVISSGTKALRKPAMLKRSLTRPYNVKFGAFFASLTGIFKLLNSLLFLLPLPRDIRLLISGMMAGVSMATVRSSTLSIYVALRALELLYFKAAKKGWTRRWYYGDVILYALSTGFMFHSVFFEGHNLRLAYWGFLERVTGGLIMEVNYEALDTLGTHSSKRIKQLREMKRREQEQRSQ